MPYTLLSDGIPISEHDTRKAAIHACTDPTWRIKLHLTEAEQDRIAARERSIMATCLPVPWSEPPGRYARLSTVKPGEVVYCPDDESAYNQRYVSIRIGRYLERFFADETREIRECWIAKCTALASATLTILATAEEIEHAYRHGPRSCMSHALSHYRSPVHPVRVYGRGDLRLAVVYADETKHRITARAIVWPDRQVHSRLYGDQILLRILLERAGYVSGAIHGARIDRIPYHDGYVIPYIDGVDGASVDRDDPSYLILDNDGAIPCCNTDGMSTDAEPEDDDPITGSCNRCNDACYNDAPYRFGCNEGRWVCHSCHGDFFADDNCHEVIQRSSYDATGRLRHRCDSCYHDELSTCATCETSWHELTLSLSDQNARRAPVDVRGHCVDCVAAGRHVDADPNTETETETEPALELVNS